MATRTLETKIVISGDEKFREKLSLARSELTKQRTIMKELSEEYKNNANTQEALTKKLERLKEVQKAYSQVVEAAKKGLENATAEKNKYAAQIKVIQENLQKAQVEQENLNLETKVGAERHAELSIEIEKYKEELEAASQGQKAAAEAVNKWTKDQTNAETAVSRTKLQILQYTDYLKEAEESTDHCATSIDQYGKKVKKTSESQEELNEKMSGTGAAVSNFASSLMSTGINKRLEELKDTLLDCVQSAAEFETALAKVSTIADTEAASMDAIKGSILRLSNETGQAVEALSEAVYNAISAGVDTAEAVDFVSTATKLAAGGFTDNATAVDILTTVLNAYNKETEEAGKMADYLITTQNLGKTTVNELAGSMGKVIPVAATYNVEMGNLSSAMAILTANGIATAESTTYLKSMLNELGDSGSTVSKTLRNQTGLSFADLMKKGYSLGDVMEILGKAVENDKGAFNELWGSSEAGIGALSLLSAGSEKYNEVLRKMEESAGATASAYEKMADTSENAQKKLENAFQNLKIAIGSDLQEQMKGVKEAGADLLTWAAEFIEKNEWLVPVLETLAAGLGLAGTAVAGYTMVTEIAIPMVKAFMAALSANPAGLVVTGLVGLIAVLTPLIAKLGSARTEIEEQAEGWKSQAEAVRETTAAYKEQKAETEQLSGNTRELAKSLKELAAKEEKSEAEKQAIADITDQLNEKIPNLGLQYDSLTDSINMTTKELDRLLETMELQERYDDAKENYTKAYTERKQATEALTEAQEALTEATARYEELWNQEGLGQDPRRLSSKSFREAAEDVAACTEAVDELQRAVSESDEVIAEMEYTINLYTIETANMTKAEREAIDAMLEAAETKRDNLPAYYEEIEAVAQTAKGYEEYASSVQANAETVMAQIQELQEKYQESYQSAYENIQNQIGLFNEMKVESSRSIDELIGSLSSQIDYMNEYAENMRQAMEYGVAEGILKQLADGSEESAAILQEIVNGGEEKIQALNEQFAKVEEGKDNFSNAIADLETYYTEELDKLIEDTENAVKDMAKYDDAYQAAVQTCHGIVAGINSQWGSVTEKYKALAQAAMRAYNQEMKIHSPSREFAWSSEMTIEGIREGVDQNKKKAAEKYEELAEESLAAYREGMQKLEEMLPYVGIAENRNTAAQNRYLQNADRTAKQETVQNTTTQTFNIYQPVKTPSEIMRAARLEQQYGLAGDM
ncbi:MAG: phage tail tape measure protein [Roseburia sp.]|nr:phage tail tape measure protein [Roseburia sp.]MCM1097786.1 phage tail tape measure protein [Ruminococcus flavefaciens]